MTYSKTAAVAAAFAFSFCSLGAFAADNSVMTAPPEGAYQAVSALVALPDFIPGLGQLYVDPETLPVGPFLGYDHDGALVNTIYMIPLSMMTAELNLDDLATPAGAVDHVDITYNAGHPGVEEPHIHVTLWNVSIDDERRVAK